MIAAVHVALYMIFTLAASRRAADFSGHVLVPCLRATNTLCALQDLRWHDSRKGDLSFVNGERCWAVMLNVRSSGWFAALTGGRHWFGVKRFGDMWYVLDLPVNALHVSSSACIASCVHSITR